MIILLYVYATKLGIIFYIGNRFGTKNGTKHNN